MEQFLVSVLHPRAREKAGSSSSNLVVDEQPLTTALLITEGWSPGLFKGKIRSKANLIEAAVIGLDIDGGMPLEEALELIKKSGLKHVVGTTTSHQMIKHKGEPPCDRYRVILFLTEPVRSAETYTATLKEAARAVGLYDAIDMAATDASRWFVPCKEIVSTGGEGLVQIATAKPFRAHVAATVAQLTTDGVAAAPDPSVKGALAKFVKDFVEHPEKNVKDFHNKLFKCIVWCKEQNYTEEEAKKYLVAGAPLGDFDNNDLYTFWDIYTNNRGGKGKFQIDWPFKIKKKVGQDADGEAIFEMKPDPARNENVHYLISSYLGYTFSFNIRRQLLYYSTRMEPTPRVYSDRVASILADQARMHQINPSAVNDAVVALASANEYDPLMEAFKKLKWDGRKGYIKELFGTLSFDSDVTEKAKEIYYQMLRRWLIGVVRKAYEPGSENNVLVFQGPQGVGKSRWLQRLAKIWPEGWGEGYISPEQKDHELRHLDNFIWHVAEFDSTTSRREVGALKDYFTKSTVSVRRPYEKYTISGSSICSFCASVNSFDFLQDATGNRRYLVIPVTDIKADHSVDMLQVMAEAREEYLANQPQWFNKEEIAEINALNQRYMSREEFIDDIAECCRPGNDALSVGAIMALLGYERLTITKGMRSNIISTLQNGGIKRKNKTNSVLFMIDANHAKKEKRKSSNQHNTNIMGKINKLKGNEEENESQKTH